MKIKTIDSTKAGIRAYLEDAAETRKVDLQSGKAMRLAVARYFLDMIGVDDAAERKAAWKQFASTPGWFGCNASAARQALKIATPDKAESLDEFDA